MIINFIITFNIDKIAIIDILRFINKTSFMDNKKQINYSLNK